MHDVDAQLVLKNNKSGHGVPAAAYKTKCAIFDGL
jgi:hypothetical protein